MIDHDRIFKELLTTFFLEFLDLFYLEVLAYLDPTALEFLDKESFTDITSGERFETDIVVKTRFRDTLAYFLVLIESEAQVRTEIPFPERIFRYVALLHFKYRLPVYPLVLFSCDTVERSEPDSYRVTFPDLDVLQFNYRVIQLRRLHWRDYAGKANPIASALLVKMGMTKAERPEVRLASLRMLAALQLNPARTELILGVINTYLKLTAQEEARFQAALAELAPAEQETTMELMTIGMEKGLEKGIQQRVAENQALLVRVLTKRLGGLTPETEARVRQLAAPQIDLLYEALLDFTQMDDLHAWLDAHPPVEPPADAAEAEAAQG